MKKAWLGFVFLCFFLLASCAVPAKDSAAPPSAADGSSAQELRDLISQYKDSGDYQSQYETAEKLIELEPSDTDAYLIAVDALTNLSKQNYDEINRLVAQSADNAADFMPIADWIAENQPDYVIKMPFFQDYASPDELNTDGITTGNMTNSAKNKNYGGWWAGGLLTWQGDWVYLSRPDEDFAIYKMHSDGSQYEKIGDNHGSSLNVIGDWIYYVNHDDSNKPYCLNISMRDMGFT